MKTTADNIFSFGDFELDANKRLLHKQGKPIVLNPKTFDLLLTLVENRGEILLKNDLLDKVWENQFVEENNLTVHVAALRKVLGETKNEHRFIVTVPGKGYSFVAEVRQGGFEDSAAENPLQRNIPEAVEGFDRSGILFGREREIAEIKNLLRGDETRLITLTGAGGSGKTRLARAVAGEAAADFADGVFFIELADVRSAELAVSVIAQMLGVKESGSTSLAEVLVDYLRQRRILLVLDNFEQILSAAPVLQKLVDSTAFLKILVTSRISLQIEAEREIVVTPLALPLHDEVSSNADLLSRYASVALFAARARAVKSSFELTAENMLAVAGICRKLDGLPLAIELAAARIKLLSPPAILDRLENSLKFLTGGADDLPLRQKTMRGTIQWSYDLLGEDEKAVFRQLSVFAGGFTVEAAESVVSGQWPVAGENTDEIQITEINSESSETKENQLTTTLDFLTSLIDNNLLSLKEQENGEVRLQMLEVVREFAAECLENAGETSKLKQNHAQFFLLLAEEAEPHLLGEMSVEWLEKLETEHDNIRAALRWMLENDVEEAARMAAALRYFWANHNHLTEGRGRLEAVLERYGRNYSEICFKLMHGIGQFARSSGDYEAAQKIYSETLAASKTANNSEQTIVALHGLAALATREGDFAAARKFTEEQLAISREVGNESKIAYALSSLGDLTLAEGDTTAARPTIEESLTISRKLGNKQVISINLLNLGVVAFTEQDDEAAVLYFTESLAIAQELGNKSLVSCCLDGFAAVCAGYGNTETAAQLAGAADELRRSIGYEIEITERLFRDAYIAKVRTALGEKSFDAAYQKGRTFDLSEAVTLVENSFGEPDGKIAEIIFETHKIEHIVIEEDEENPAESSWNKSARQNGLEIDVTPRSYPDVRPQISRLDRLKNNRPLMAGLILLLAVLGTGTYFWQRGQNSKGSAPFQQISINRLTTIGKIANAAFSPDGKLFVYSVGVPRTLWLGHTSGGEPFELRSAADVTYHSLRFSPDSNQIYYVVTGKEYPKGALFRLPVFGGVPEKLRENIKPQIAFAPDMNRFAFVRNDPEKDTSTLIITDIKGDSEHQIVSRPIKFHFQPLSPAWSADGKTIAVSAVSDASDGVNYEVFAVSVGDGKLKRLTSRKFRSIPSLEWLTDGSGLVMTAVEQPQLDHQLWYISYPRGETRHINPDLSNYGSPLGISADGDALLAIKGEYVSNIWVAPADNPTQARQITFSAIGGRYGRLGLEWMPDGRIMYVAYINKSQSLWTMNADGSGQKQLTPDGFIDLDPSVTADGQVIVFGSNRSGSFEIWRVNANGGDLRQLTFDHNNEMPSVSPDGRWAVYISTRDGLNNVWRVPPEGGEPVKISDNPATWIRVSPDSQFIACGYNDNGKTKLAVLSIDGGEPVKLFDLPATANLRYALRWTPDGKTLTYRDWVNGYWRQPLDGGEPQRIENLPQEKLFAYSWSPDGKQIAFTRGLEIRDVVLIRNTGEK